MCLEIIPMGAKYRLATTGTANDTRCRRKNGIKIQTERLESGSAPLHVVYI